MSRIISYPYANNVVDDSAWIGTEASTTRTRQYTAKAVADYLNINGKISIGGQLAYQYVSDPLEAPGTFSITSGGLDNVLFANITALTLSMKDRGGQNVVAFLNYLVGSDILISKQNEISSFGHYEVVSYNVNPDDSQFYDLVVVFKGGNGSMNDLDFYDATNFTLASEIVGLYTFNVDSDNGVPFTVQNNNTIDFTSANITVSNVNSAISFNLPATGVTAGAYTTANITVDSFGRITAAADGTSGPGGTGTTNFVTKWVNATTLGDSAIFDNGTNVGIGTSSPSDKLTVNGNARVTGVLKLASGSAGAPSLAHRADENTGLFFPLNDNIGFTTSNSEKMRITSTGNVGIGTTSPAYKLDVATSLAVTFGAASILRINKESLGNIGITAPKIYSDETLGFQSNNATTSFNFAYGSTSLMTIKSNGNVGIGTTAPTEKLHVFGGAAAIKIDSTTNEASLKYDNSTTTATIKLANNDLKTELGGSEVMRILANGNIGIGTTSPTEKLTIAGNNKILFTGVSLQNLPASIGTDSDDHLAITAGIGSGKKITIGITGRLFEIQGSNNKYQNDNHIFSNYAGVESMRVISNGNVGIGTTSPTEKLEVDGNAKATSFIKDGGTSSQYLMADGSVTTGGGGGGSSNWTVTGNNIYNSNSGNVGIGTTTPTGKLELDGGDFVINADHLIKSKNSLNYIDIYKASDASMRFRMGHATVGRFQFLNNANTEVFTIDARNEKVGIGTTTPSNPLTVVGADSVGIDDYILHNNDGNTKFGFPSNDTFKIRTAGDDRFYINSSGNVGIGTTAPAYKLHISSLNNNDGLAVHYPATNSTQFPFYVGDSASSTYARLNNAVFELKRNGAASTIKTVGSSNDLVLQSANNLVFNSNGATTQMYINTSGNVGIGTTSPSNLLDIYGAGGITVGYNSSGSSIRKALVHKSAGVERWSLNTISVSNFSINVNNSERLRINNNGNVGIGTASPTQKLHVVGVGSFGTSTSQTLVDYDGLNAVGNTDYIRFKVDNSEKLRIKSNGNVGIGTTNPTEILHLSSDDTNLWTRIDNTNWAGGEFSGLWFRHGAQDHFSTQIKSYVEGGSGEVSLKFLTSINSATNQAMTIRGDGDVGIGTDSPSEKLEVSGNVKATRVISNTLRDTNNNGYLITTVTNIANTDTTVGNATTANNLSLNVKTSGNVTVPNGNVGIGTTSPQATLDVNGPIKVGTAQTLAASSTTVGAIRYRAGSNNSYMEMVMQTGVSGFTPVYAWVIIKQNTW